MWKHVSLFSGIGGFDLAAETAGFKTVLQVEIDDYCTKILEKHWPTVKRIRDIHDVNLHGKNKTLLTGSPPCQPFSVAGKRRGKDDDRDLWPEMLRIVEESRPDWVVGENAANFVHMGLEQAVVTLENLDYTVRAFCIPACAVYSQHKRERVFIVAHSNKVRCHRGLSARQGIQWQDQAWTEIDASPMPWQNGLQDYDRPVYHNLVVRFAMA